MRSGVVVKCVGAPLNESILKRDPWSRISYLYLQLAVKNCCPYAVWDHKGITTYVDALFFFDLQLLPAACFDSFF